MIKRTLLLAVLLAVAPRPAVAQSVPDNTWAPAGPQFSTVLALERAPGAPATVLAGAYFGGLYRSVDYGFSWAHLDTPFSSRSIFAIAFAGDGTIYVGTFRDGVYASTDGGQDWVARNTGLTDLDVQGLAVDPFAPNVLLAATSNGGVFRTQTGGQSWTRVDNEATPLRGKAIAFDPVNAGVVYLGTIGQGAYRSIDGGRTFAPFSDGITSVSVLSLRFGAPPARTLYAAGDNGAFKLTTGATTWAEMTGNLPPYPISDLLPHPSLEHMVFAATLVGTFVAPDVASSSDWIPWTNVPTRVLASDPTGTVIHAASIHGGMEATLDFGRTWYPANWGIQNLFVGALTAVSRPAGTTVYAGSDFAVHRGIAGQWETFFDQKQGVFDIQADPTTPNTMYIGTERSGVWKSTDGGAGWIPSSTNIVPAQIYSLGQSADGQMLFAGTSSGLFLSPDRGQLWIHSTEAQLGIVLSVAPDPARHPFLFAGGANGTVLRSEDGGWSYTNASNGLPTENIVSLVTAPWEKTYAITGSGSLYATSDNGLNWFPAGNGVPAPALAIAADPQRPWILYLGTSGGGVYKSESGSLEWVSRSTGLTSPYVFSLAVNPATPATVYAGTHDGVFKSTDGGAIWTRRSAGLPGAAVTALLVDATSPQVVYASIQDAGIFRSADGGTSWLPVTGTLPAAGSMPILINRLQPAQLFAGTSLNGVYRSDNSGGSWQKSSFGMTLFVRGLALDPLAPSTLYAGSLGAGVFKSTDAGDTWTNIGLRDRNVLKLAINPTQTQTVYAATSRGLNRTTNGGISWHGLGQKAAFVHSLVVDPRDRNRLYIGTTAGSVYRSTDGGDTWEPAASGLPAFTVLALAIDGSTGALYSSAERNGVWRSLNNGDSWTRLAFGPLDTELVASLTVGPAGEVYAATLGAGVFIYRNGSWSLASQGLASPMVADVGVTATGVLVAATYDSGIFRSTDAGASWTWAGSGLTTSRVTRLSVGPGQAIYAATPDGVFVSRDEALTWERAGVALRGMNTWSVSGETATGRLFAAMNGAGVFRSTDDGATWTGSTAGMMNTDVHTVEFGPGANDLYAATLGGGVLRSRDGGATWSGGTTLDLSDSFVLAIAVNPVVTQTIYAGTAGRGVLKSTNGGVDWTPASNGLGSLFVLSLAVDRQHPDTLYAGTADAGVFATTDGGRNWRALNAGLFNHVVTSLAIDPADSSRVYAGTEGGGVFANRVNLAAVPCTFAVTPPAASIASAATTFNVQVTTGPACSWGIEGGPDWLAVPGSEPSRIGSAVVVVSAAANAGQDARSAAITVAGQRIMVVQNGSARLFRVTVSHAGTGSGHVSSNRLGLSCGTDCEQLFADGLAVALTATPNQGSVLAGWEGHADCADGMLVMSSDRACVARFEQTSDFDEDGLPNLWEAQFGLDAGSASGDNGANGDPDGDGKTNAQELEDGTHPRGFVTRYFASGTAAAPVSTQLDLFNAGTDAAHLLVRLTPDSGARVSEYRSLAAMARHSIDTSALASPLTGGFSVVIESDRPVVAGRTITRMAPHATSGDTATAAANGWFVAAAPVSDNARLEYVLFNPGDTDAQVDIFYLPASGPASVANHLIPAGARRVIDAAFESSLQGDVGAVISADVPIVVEATAASADGDSAVGSLAVSTPAYLQFLSAGRTGPLVSTRLHLLNPTGAAASVTLFYVLNGGVVQKVHSVPPFGHQTVNPGTDDFVLADASFGVVATSSSPFVLFGSDWWPGSQAADWYGGSAAAAATTAGARWAIASGMVGGPLNSETEFAVTNVTGHAGTLRMQLVFDDGTSVTRDLALPAATRLTVDVGAEIPEAAWKTFSAIVEAVAVAGGERPDIVVEHATYTSPDGARTGGTRVMATPIP